MSSQRNINCVNQKIKLNCGLIGLKKASKYSPKNKKTEKAFKLCPSYVFVESVIPKKMGLFIRLIKS